MYVCLPAPLNTYCICPQEGQTALLLACRNCYSDIVPLLLERGANVDAATYGIGWTPLHYATMTGAKRSVSQLLELGANSDARNSVGSWY
jgi:ankyrin repeat protein